MLYQIQYDICSIVIFAFSLYYVLSFKGVKRVQNRFFVLMSLDGLITAAADILSAYTISYPGAFPLSVKVVATYLYILFHNLQPLLLILYATYALSFWPEKRERMRFLWLLTVPYVCGLLFVLANPWTHLVFYFDDAGIYHRGVCMAFMYGIAVLYSILLVALLIRRRHRINTYLAGCFIFCVIASVLASALQLLHPDLLVELFAESVVAVGLMLEVSSQEESIDRVTGLNNADVFLEDNRLAIGLHPYRLIVIRLTNIPYYNATVGIPIVEGALAQIARMLKEREIGKTYYCGNGVFALMLTDSTEDDIRHEIASLRNYFQEAVVYEDVSLAFHTQILRINVPENASTMERIMLLVEADYHTDSRRCTVYDGEELKLVERDVAIERALQRALKERTLTVHFQPIWWREDNKIHSAEALLRLFDDDLGMVHTDEFIAVAEKSGLIYDVGIYIMEEVCRLYRERNLQRIGIEYIEVNLSAVQCMRRGLPREFERILKENNLDGSRINLEITESAAADNLEMLQDNLGSLADLGFTFSLDDYGTGYSNFTYILSLAFDNIKLDRSVLWSSDTDDNAKSILRHSIRMIQEIGYKALVEGVETALQKQMLCDFKCDYLQGYYFSRPVDIDAFIDYVTRFNNGVAA